MRVAVIGAGIVGVATAWELAGAGHAVTVFEQRGSVAAECSFAHAGWTAPDTDRICPPPPLPWAHDAPAGWPWQAVRWRWRHARHRRQARRAGATPGAAARAALDALADDGRRRALGVCEALGTDLASRHGALLLLPSEAELARARPGLKRLAERGAAFVLLDAERARAVEPALAPGAALRAAVRLPDDVTANGRRLAQALRAHGEARGVRWRLGAAVDRLRPGAEPVVDTADGASAAFDAVVVCGGADTDALLRPAGVRLPLAAWRGRSVTAPLRRLDGHPDPGPRGGVLDLRTGIRITRLGDRVRASDAGALQPGPAGDGAMQDAADGPALQRLYAALETWFPGAAVLSHARAWSGVCAVSPDGLPLVGASGAAGVWLNVGHGLLGGTLALSTAAVLAAQLAGGENAASAAARACAPARLRGRDGAATP